MGQGGKICLFSSWYALKLNQILNNFTNLFCRFKHHHGKGQNSQFKQQPAHQAISLPNCLKNTIHHPQKQPNQYQVQNSLAKTFFSLAFLCFYYQQQIKAKRLAQELPSKTEMRVQLINSFPFHALKNVLFNMWFQVPPQTGLIYNSLYNKIRVIMNTIYKQLQNTPQMHNSPTPFQLLSNQDFLFFSKIYSLELGFNLSQSLTNQSPVQTSWRDKYESHSKTNIVLNGTMGKKKLICKVSSIGFDHENATKTSKKSRQKETRNISSNLLRIFFKNLIELKFYDRKLTLIASRFKTGFTNDSFYSWIEGFGINFKNYIRESQVNQIIKQNQPLHFRKAFVVLLDLYCKECGVLHCLTSKRIERNSVKMHLEGAKNLWSDVLNGFKLQQ